MIRIVLVFIFSCLSSFGRPSVLVVEAEEMVGRWLDRCGNVDVLSDYYEGHSHYMDFYDMSQCSGSRMGYLVMPLMIKDRHKKYELLSGRVYLPEVLNQKERVLDSLLQFQNEDGSWGQGKEVRAVTCEVLALYYGDVCTSCHLRYGEAVDRAVEYLVRQPAPVVGKSEDVKLRSLCWEVIALTEAYIYGRIIDYELEGLEQRIVVLGSVLMREAEGYFGKPADSDFFIIVDALMHLRSTGLRVPKLGALLKHIYRTKHAEVNSAQGLMVQVLMGRYYFPSKKSWVCFSQLTDVLLLVEKWSGERVSDEFALLSRFTKLDKREHHMEWVLRRSAELLKETKLIKSNESILDTVQLVRCLQAPYCYSWKPEGYRKIL